MSVWNGTLAFGLVTIPIKVSTAARAKAIKFNQLHTCGSRIKQKTVCPECEKEVESAEIIKGWEENNAVRPTSEEIKECLPESSKVLEIEKMVPISEVDPLLFDSSYFLAPEQAGRKAYKLLYEALKTEGKYAIGRLTMSSREHIVVIRPYRDVLVFHTMYYEAEVNERPNLDFSGITISPKEMQLAGALISAQADSFDHSAYSDGYQSQLYSMLLAMQAGQPQAEKPKAKPAATDTTDLLAALTASLSANKKAA
jgi:DNA end-binding protein Ku